MFRVVLYSYWGVRLEPHKWNADAAVILYEFIGNLRYCSKAFSIITNLPKITKKSKLAIYTVGKYIYQVWQEFQKINNGEYSGVCEKVGNYGRFPTAIESAILLGR
ncbi:MAG: hypothetical protein L3J59_13120 [Methylococcaceae bacterium]|nr:hypothetical protein [Methylococcaceae bacterium]